MTTYARPKPPAINTLPVELLSYVFVLSTHCTSEQPPNDTDPTPTFTAESVKTPLSLASVSQYWRRVALNTPRLWTSLCITMQMIHQVEDNTSPEPLSASASKTTIDVRHIVTYLALSRQYPLDVLIDARDYDWDFVEDEIALTPDIESYIPPFSGTCMKTVFELLLPDLHRWRTLSILTDTWKPMHSALESINAPLNTQGAPLLESLILMRCNDFISFASEFQPASLKNPALFSNPKPASSRNILPRLKHLSLRGVHVDWPSLGIALSSSKTGLWSMELGSHCADVRPTVSDFHHLLTASPRLRKLIVSGSGPMVPVDGPEDIAGRHDSYRTSLLDLTSLTLGYRSAPEGELILQMVDAPNLTSLVLEEATYPADPDVIDAGSILTYLGTGESQTAKERYLATYDHTALGGSQYHSKPRKDSTSSIASTSTCVGSSTEIDGRLYDDDDDMTLVDFDVKSHPPFPLLGTVTLKGVQASSPIAIGTFMGSLSKVQRLEVADMSVKTLEALLGESSDPKGMAMDLPNQPFASTSTAPSSLPCPQLQSLSLRNACMHSDGLDFILNRLVSERKDRGGCRLEGIDVHLAPSAPVTSCQIQLDGSVMLIGDALLEQNYVGFNKAGVSVKLFRHTLASDDDIDEELGLNETMLPLDTAASLNQGGGFNAPLFDAFYSAMMFSNGSR